MIEGAPQNILWCHGIHQAAHDEMLQTIPNITFIEGLPTDLESRIDPSQRNMVVIDDLMNELNNDKRLTNIFTKGCHHMNLSCLHITKYVLSRRGNKKHFSQRSLLDYFQITSR